MELMCPDHLKWGYFKDKISNSKNNISEETINILKEYNVDDKKYHEYIYDNDEILIRNNKERKHEDRS